MVGGGGVAVGSAYSHCYPDELLTLCLFSFPVSNREHNDILNQCTIYQSKDLRTIVVFLQIVTGMVSVETRQGIVLRDNRRESRKISETFMKHNIVVYFRETFVLENVKRTLG